MIHPGYSSRRTFLSVAAGCVSAPMVVTARALGRGATAPSERVNVGIIGSGGRGVFETRQYPWFDNAQIVAVCDAQQSRRVSAREQLEQLYGARAGAGSFRGIAMYADFRELLARRDIDAVYIATPDHWHVPITVAAMKAGKHCHTEKPLGVSIEQDLAALKAVRKYKKVFQYGAERRATAEARKAIELVVNGRIGKVQKIFVVGPPSASGGSATPVIPIPKGFDYDMWLGPAPEKPFCADRCLEGYRKQNGIFFIYDYSLGFVSNWSAHPLDLVQWWADHAGRAKIPVEYAGTGRLPVEGLFDTAVAWDVRCTYDDGLELRYVDSMSYLAYSDAPHPEMPWGRRGVTNVHNGAVFIGSEGWVIASYEKVAAHPATLMDSVIGPNEVHLPDSALPRIPNGMPRGHQEEATAGLHQNWIHAIAGGRPTVGGIESAVRSDLISQLVELTVRTGQGLRWNPSRQIIEGNEAARKMMSRPMRGPWKLS